MKYPTYKEFVEWIGGPDKAASIFTDPIHQSDERIAYLYRYLYQRSRLNGAAPVDSSLIHTVSQFFDYYDSRQDDLPQADDQYIPSEDELEFNREELKWHKFFDTPASAVKWPSELHKAEVRKLLKEGVKINAIKYVRLVSNMGLKEAKDWVDDFQKTEGLSIW